LHKATHLATSCTWFREGRRWLRPICCRTSRAAGAPSPAAVFNTVDRTFAYPNNLTNGIWHLNSDQIIVGNYSDAGY